MIPLADRLRPKVLKEFIGQKHLLSENKLLFQTLSNKKIFSMILWGPPGVGKTTLARIIAKEIGLEMMEFSAGSTGVAQLKNLFEKIKGQLEPPIIFIDEIHRFNKAQQDILLPYVENGTIILIGATTENPSFEVIGPLLSRTRVLVLQPLSVEDLLEIIKCGLRQLKVKIDKSGKDLLIELSGGDGRVLLNTLEIAANLTKGTIGKDIIEEAFQKKALMYDKASDEHFNTISAFIKSMRASNVNSALYYLARMVEAGEDPLFIARRMVIFASEDIGQAVPTALVLANEVFRACETIGYPECQINLAQGVVYLSLAKKDRSSQDAYFKALEDVRSFGNLPIPINIRNAPTNLMKNLGFSKGYNMYTDEDLLPDKLKGRKYYIPKKRE